MYSLKNSAHDLLAVTVADLKFRPLGGIIGMIDRKMPISFFYFNDMGDPNRQFPAVGIDGSELNSLRLHHFTQDGMRMEIDFQARILLC
ncbi:hypothetical protein AGR7A_Lc180058 [Agrobacterium deltaense NCPPB 1641]|uniref:Uncharacterized protein n=1 Tax=Agrobacterium deltaense NCPPB 1641 TaxID=1183425 RepID=A0A1S7U3F7_9HYPH|nr:hypothetical protein AGR7A_Lc180058 [Agrobacterium deltaense NCPPB 1641]